MRTALAALLLFTIVPMSASAPRKPAYRARGVVRNAKEAKQIAELETGGIAVNARRTRLNGATCGWEVDVHMPREDRGWRCMVDCDTRAVHTKDRIPNPPVKASRNRN
jgi:hypothetical protein